MEIYGSKENGMIIMFKEKRERKLKRKNGVYFICLDFILFLKIKFFFYILFMMKENIIRMER